MMEIKKLLAVSIILLFLGVSVAPSINFTVVKASTDDDLMEVTTQACGIQGYGNTTVKLTREHYKDLEQYLVDFRARLNQTTTVKEAVPIFKDAVVELDKYGLLPRGMSVERAQRLVTGEYKYREKTNFFREPTNILTNALCFIVGDIFEPYNLGYISPLMLVFLLIGLPIIIIGVILAIITGIPSLALYLFAILLTKTIEIPVGFMNVINLKGDVHGVLTTLGLLGMATIEGEMKGIIAGFTGIKIWNDDDLFILGFSLFTNIENV
jgi:hypothetical protein